MNHVSRDAGWELFFWCLRELAARSRLSAEVHRAVQQTFNPSTARPRAARTAPQPLARRNRALVKAALCSLECIALKHLHRGGLLAGSRALGPTAQYTASRCAAPASRIAPLSFSGD